MTRELLTRIPLETQLAGYTGWKIVPETDANDLALSDMPGFVTLLGEARNTAFDTSLVPTAGEQDLTLKIHFHHPQHDVVAKRTLRSDMLASAETFLATVYTPPSVLPADAVRIDHIRLIRVEPPFTTRSDTRSTIIIRLLCSYTIL